MSSRTWNKSSRSRRSALNNQDLDEREPPYMDNIARSRRGSHFCPVAEYFQIKATTHVYIRSIKGENADCSCNTSDGRHLLALLLLCSSFLCWPLPLRRFAGLVRLVRWRRLFCHIFVWGVWKINGETFPDSCGTVRGDKHVLYVTDFKALHSFKHKHL